MTAGPDTLELTGSLDVGGENMKTVAEFTVEAGQRESFNLNYRPSYHEARGASDAEQELRNTEERWHRWSERCQYRGRWRPAVVRSLITLKALTYKPTGGIVAAPTTSLPEMPGGVRNWDYRYCWLRDATFTLNALLLAGYTKEATDWREWLLRAVAGSPKDLQILYSVTGARRLDEFELPELPGYLGAKPVRVGNAASRQFQLDVYGEVMDTLHLARLSGLDPEPAAWNFQRAMLEFLATRLAGAGRRHMGDTRRTQALHAFEGHGLGGLRSGHQGCGARWLGGAPGTLARNSRCHSCGGLREGFLHDASSLRAVL
jgi:GH15 family glucan-1,4-alpha-glucosidase